jgi:hypothetical protein
MSALSPFSANQVFTVPSTLVGLLLRKIFKWCNFLILDWLNDATLHLGRSIDTDALISHWQWRISEKRRCRRVQITSFSVKILW